MTVRVFVACVFLLSCDFNLLAATGGNDVLDELADSSRVKKLFQSYRDGTADNLVDFPELEWDDAADLMIVARSKRTITRFPNNPLSSQMQVDALEGSVALWLIEGIRRGGRHASLNPMCLSKDGDRNEKYNTRSKKCYPEVLKLYVQWWEDKQTDLAQKMEIDPLSGSGYSWYGDWK